MILLVVETHWFLTAGILTSAMSTRHKQSVKSLSMAHQKTVSPESLSPIHEILQVEVKSNDPSSTKTIRGTHYEGARVGSPCGAAAHIQPSEGDRAIARGRTLAEGWPHLRDFGEIFGFPNRSDLDAGGNADAGAQSRCQNFHSRP